MFVALIIYFHQIGFKFESNQRANKITLLQMIHPKTGAKVKDVRIDQRCQSVCNSKALRQVDTRAQNIQLRR